MAEECYVLDGRTFSDFAGFIEEFNRVFCSRFHAKWGGSLDAFDDYLSWPGGRYALVWKYSDLSRERLGHGEMAKWLEERVQNCHPTNVPHMQERLTKAQRNEGPTMFDLLIEIIRDNAEYVELRLD